VSIACAEETGTVEYGTLPDWLAGAGTVGALAVALVLLAQDLRARREVEEDRRRAQASRVVCWLESIEDAPGPPQPGVAAVIGARHVEVVLHNGSGEPVFDCQVHVELDVTAPDRFELDLKAPETFHSHRQQLLTEQMLPPGRTRRPLSLPGANLPHASAWMVFTDASNRRWQRGHSGKLSQMVDRPAPADAAPRVGCGALWYGPRR
jgi:hypothetical protein